MSPLGGGARSTYLYLVGGLLQCSPSAATSKDILSVFVIVAFDYS